MSGLEAGWLLSSKVLSLPGDCEEARIWRHRARAEACLISDRHFVDSHWGSSSHPAQPPKNPAVGQGDVGPAGPAPHALLARHQCGQVRLHR